MNTPSCAERTKNEEKEHPNAEIREEDYRTRCTKPEKQSVPDSHPKMFVPVPDFCVRPLPAKKALAFRPLVDRRVER